MNNRMINIYEIRITFSVCIIIMLRMLGMFMAAPAMHTTGVLLYQSNTILIGLAIGIYGLMQSIFQIPFGFLSNKIGYKYTILFGLSLFTLGSFILCISNSIFGVIIGRGLQGIGTISSVLIAFLSSVIRTQHYTKSIVCIGLSFGLSFLGSIVFGPIVISYIGLCGLFKVTLLLSIFCFYIAIKYIFQDSKVIFYNKVVKIYESNDITKIYDTFGYIISVFFLHFILTVNFVVFPKTMELLGYSLEQHFKIYFLIIMFALFTALPLMICSEYKDYTRFLIILLIVIIGMSSCILLIFQNNFSIFLISIYFFFISFIIIESFLPSLLNRILSIKNKNIVMSIYSTSQFLGTALGGIFGGIVYKYFGLMELLLLLCLVSIIWFFIFYFISLPLHIYTVSVFLKKNRNFDFNICKLLKCNNGIISIEYLVHNNSVLIKYDCHTCNIQQIKKFFKNLS